MKRRAFVGAFGTAVTVGTAGCSLDTASSEVDTRSPSRTRQTTESEPPTNTEVPEATDSKLAEIDERVDRAESMFVSWHGVHAEQVLDVGVTSNPSTFDRIKSLLVTAIADYETYVSTHPEASGVLPLLNRARMLLDWAVIQRNLIFAYNTLDSAASALFDGRYQKFSRLMARSERHRTDANDRLHAHLSRRLTTIADVSSSVYESKIDQFRSERRGIETGADALAAQRPVVEKTVAVLRSYVAGEFDRTRATETIDAATVIADDLSAFCCTAPPVAATLTRLENAMTAIGNGLRTLKTSVENDATEQTAAETFRSARLVRRSEGPLAELVASL